MNKISKKEEIDVQLGILKYIHDVCEKNNIQYFLTAGSLIGAVRHKGIIPWDDDIDIGLTRKNYEKFLDIVKKDNNERYKLLDHSVQSDYFYPFAKIVDTKTILIEEKFNPIENYGIYVDVFSYNGTPNDDKEREKFFKKIMNNQKTIFRKNTKCMNTKNKIKIILKKCFRLYLKTKSMDKILEKNNKLQEMYDCDTSKYLINNWNMLRYEKAMLLREDFNEIIDYKFENLVVKIPKNYDRILTTLYGDYMTPPPEDKRISTHDINVYWRDEENEK